MTWERDIARVANSYSLFFAIQGITGLAIYFTIGKSEDLWLLILSIVFSSLSIVGVVTGLFLTSKVEKEAS